MTNIDAVSVVAMVKRCVGHINATGEAEYDKESIDNLKRYFMVIDALIGDVQDLLPNFEDERVSVMLIGNHALGYLSGLSKDIDARLKEAYRKHWEIADNRVVK